MSKQERFEAPDISADQGTVDMKTVRDSGYKYIGLRAGYDENHVDRKFADNAAACIGLGMKVLLYWFSYAYTTAMAAAEAGFAIAQAEKYWKRCPIAFDLEQDGRRYAETRGVNVDRKLATDMAVAFLRKVKEAGFVPVLYTNRDFLKNYFDMERIHAETGGVYVWFALYGVRVLPASELEIADLWQYTSKGSVPGISGDVDVNKVYTDIWAGSESVGGNDIGTGDGSYTVVKGDTLSGIGRKLKVAWTEIASANGLKSPYTIYPGQKLRIPYPSGAGDADKKPVPNRYIRSFQAAANADGYRDAQGGRLVENGVEDAATRFVCGRVSLQARYVKALWVERSVGELVKWLQGRLKELLLTELEITGEYDAATVAEVKEFQKKYGLTVDGIAGYDTIRMMYG